MNERAFGGIIKSPDPRNYDLASINKALGGGGARKSSNDYTALTIEDQLKQPACGGHGGNRFKEVQNLRAGKVTRGSPRFLWKNIKDIDGYPIESGTDHNSIYKAMRNVGICSYALAGNDTSLSLEDYRNLKVTQAMLDDASHNKTEAEAFIYKPTFTQICDTIDLHGACTILMRVGKNMYADKKGTTWDGKRILPLSTTNFPMDSGHFMDAENYDKDLGIIYGANEWSDEWGNNGYFSIGIEYIPYVDSIGTAVNHDDIPVQAIPQITKTLSYGMTDAQVKLLQTYLNDTGFTVATSGAGSKGNETTFFGSATAQAVKAWQLAKGINDFKYETNMKNIVFGPKSRQAMSQG